METLFFGAAGWCGTKYPGWRNDFQEPNPIPWRLFVVLSIIGAIVGTVGGLAFNNAVGEESLFAGQEMIASGLFSFASSNIITGFVSNMIQRSQLG
ncbi:hypothetical protein [Flavobacterium sp. H122]|uniref:hypothetical protein n=1 Tax=Flavobacterium sp. H122 TaxID=2529860 RepID=UPI0010AB3438|nr:hypothetical protein [Flavobacterium sp. H122]